VCRRKVTASTGFAAIGASKRRKRLVKFSNSEARGFVMFFWSFWWGLLNCANETVKLLDEEPTLTFCTAGVTGFINMRYIDCMYRNSTFSSRVCKEWWAWSVW
jgi:hypothetical protein